MFLVMTIRANKFKVIEIIVVSIPIFVVNLQYLEFTITTPLAIFPPCS